MNRIAITGTSNERRTILAKALSAMTGFDCILQIPYTIIAAKYKMAIEITECQWPDSFVYCMEEFTQRVISEKNLKDNFISDGVFDEICWLKCRYPHVELIYERPMIISFEKVAANYANAQYDYIFHIDSSDDSNITEKCLKQIYHQYNINHNIINNQNDEEVLNQIIACLRVNPLLSAKYALHKNL